MTGIRPGRTGSSLHLGYAGSIVLFALAICVPAIGYRWWRWNPVAPFWIAYVLTRPLGASVADWAGKGADVGGLGRGDGPVALAFAVAIAVLVVRLSWRTAPQQRGAQVAALE